MGQNSKSAGKYRKIRSTVELKPKTKGQEEYIELIRTNDLTICDGPAGSGKAQPLDAVVLTPSGFKKMGDLKLGDMVSTPNGKSARILGIYPQGSIDTYKVTFSDGTSTECSLDHLWYTETCLDRDAKRIGSVKTLKDIITSLRTKNNKNNHSIPLTSPLVFSSDKTLEMNPYVLGVLLGDGCLSTKNVVMLSTGDKEILDRCEQLEDVEFRKTKNNAFDYNAKATITSNKQNILSRKIIKLGLNGTKSDTKFIPEEYKFASIEDRIEILRGLMDTDGTIRKSKNSCNITYTSVSEKLAKDVQFIIESLGGKASMNTRFTYYTYKGEKKKGKLSYRLHISMPPEINPFKLARKAELYIERHKYLPLRYITNVEMVGNKLSQCIYIDSDDHLYITNNCIVTHNTLVGVGMAIKLYKESNGLYNRIVIARPAVVACDEDLGFLPGDLDDKMKPYMLPIMDSLKTFLDESEILELFNLGVIEVVPIAYMRGRTFNKAICILDEAQNATAKQMKMFLTRLGFQTKAIVEGDSTQCDLNGPDRVNNGLVDAMDRLEDVEGIGVIELTPIDIVRSELCNKIIDAYGD